MELSRRHSSDRRVAVGVLGLRAVRYIGEGADTSGPPVPRLKVWSTRCDERPTYHRDSGIYGFLRLPPGLNRIHIVDPAQRYLARALEVKVPGRSGVQAALEEGIELSTELPQVLYANVQMRPARGFVLPSGDTAVWGRVMSSVGQSMPYVRLAIETRFLRTNGTPEAGAVPQEGTVLTYSDLDGIYFARLPHERPAVRATSEDDGGSGSTESGAEDGGLVTEFERHLSVHRLNEGAMERLTRLSAVDPLLAFPARFDGDINAPDGQYVECDFSLLDEAGEERFPEHDKNPMLRIHVGRRVRFDIVLK